MKRLLSLCLLPLCLYAQTSSFPTSVDSDATLFVTGDNVQSTLTVAMAIGDGSATVASGTGFAANMIATVCDTITATGKCTVYEHMKITGVAGNILSVTRGFAGTSARPHSAGKNVSILLDSAHIQAVKSAIIAIENAIIGLSTNSSTSYDWSQTPGGSLLASMNQAITLTPCPGGVNGADVYHYVYLSGGTGAAEAALITGGTCTSGAASGTITLIPANPHSGAWTVGSATAGMQEAVNALPTSGGIVQAACGQKTLYQTLSIGNGSGVTPGSRNNISLRGCGKGRDSSETAATELLWAGPAAGTVVRFQGPMFSGGIQDVRINGGNTATLLLDIYATSLATFERLALVDAGTNSIALRLDAGADVAATTQQNAFRDINIQARASGASGIQLGPTNLNYDGGTFVNEFHNITVVYANDTAASYAVYLGWADNNSFFAGGSQAVTNPGSGCSIKHVRQPAGAGNFDFLPSENTFFRFTMSGNGPCGSSGRSIGTIYWPYQVLDSGGVPNASTPGHRGWLQNGDFFDSSGRIGAQNAFRVYAREDLAQLSVSGFTYYTATGTVQSTGTALVGTGTAFTTELPKGKLLNSGNEFRWCDVVTDDTHCTLNAAFPDDLKAGTTIGYAIGANMRFYSDSDAHVATQDHSKFVFTTDGQDRGGMDEDGFWYSTAKTYGELITFTPANGRWVYCSDCTIASPCAGSGPGAMAKRLGGAWVCN